MKQNKHDTIVEEAVKLTLINLGFRVDQPSEMQADAAWVRNMRTGSEETKRYIKGAFIGVVVPGLLYLLWEATKDIFRK